MRWVLASWRALLAAFLLWVLGCPTARRFEGPARPLVVDSVRPLLAAERAGLLPGDVVVSWRRGERGEPIRTAFDLALLEREQAPLGPVTLVGRRGEQRREWMVPSGRWQVAARPELGQAELALVEEAAERLATGQVSALIADFDAAAESARLAGDVVAAVWWHFALAQRLETPETAAEAKASYTRAVELAAPLGHASLTAHLLREQASFLDDVDEAEAAEAALERAFRLESQLSPPALARAETLSLHAAVVGPRGRLEQARKLLQQAQVILEAEAPASLPLAEVLNRLGIVAYRTEQLELAQDRLSRADELFSRLDPGSASHALAVSNLGVLARLRGELDASEALYRRAIGMTERIAPEGRQLIGPLTNLGTVLIERGDLEAAERIYHRALEISLRTEVENTSRSLLLVNLGNIAQNRGELDEAERFFRQAAAIQERLVPGDFLHTQTLSNLGTVLSERGDPAAARELFRQVLETEEKAGRQLQGVASALANLGKLEMDSGGDLSQASSYLQRAQEILSRKQDETLHLSDVLFYRSQLAGLRGESQEAYELAVHSLEIRRKVASGSWAEAEATHHLGLLEQARGRKEAAGELLCRAVGVVDLQRRRLGGGEASRLAFAAKSASLVRDCITARLAEGRSEAAYEASELGRARAFLALLAERDLSFADAERVEALRQAAPLDLGATRAVLDAGTYLLSYSVGETSTQLFVVSPPEAAGSGLRVIELPAGEEELRGRVALMLSRLAAPGGSGWSGVRASARELYDLLLAPVAASLVPAERFVVLADGPLHGLPFAALLDAGGLADRPLHFALSATTYAQLRAGRSTNPNRPRRVVAFGDPAYPPARGGRLTLRSGPQGLPPLPSTRGEVEALTQLFPGVRAYLGSDATEVALVAQAADAEILHLACHAWMDNNDPLSSGLALSASEPREAEATDEAEDGLLHVAEILERVRLSADLVTLSACDTALGQEVRGEGMVGLTRAFHFAGARSVVASLWQVSDGATSELMRRFYGHLSRGLPKDQALAAAQRELKLSRDPALAHPRQWAAFQLYGDWR